MAHTTREEMHEIIDRAQMKLVWDYWYDDDMIIELVLIIRELRHTIDNNG